MFRIVSFVTQKGGAGKTTLATSFAVAAAEAGETVILFDLDFQKSAVAWRELRGAPRSETNPNPIANPGTPIVQEFPADRLGQMEQLLRSLEQKGATLVVLDTPGEDSPVVNSCIAASDLALILLAPTKPDLLAVRPTLQAVMRGNGKFGFVLNNCPTQPNNPRPERMALGLSSIGPVAPVRVGRRADYQDAFAEGQGVTEWAPDGVAANEMRQLLAWVNERTKENAVEHTPALAVGF